MEGDDLSYRVAPPDAQWFFMGPSEIVANYSDIQAR